MQRMNSDSELLRRYVDDKSDTAFAELVARYINLVYATALRRTSNDYHRANDIVQMVFTTLAKKSPALVDHPLLAGWMYRTTQNLALKAVRVEQRRVTREQKAHAMEEIQAPTETPGWEEIRPVIDWAMHGLGERDREIMLRRYFSGQAFVEIGTALGMTEHAARMRAERALEKLRGRLRRRGVTSTNAALAVILAGEASAVAPMGLAASVAAASVAGAAEGIAVTAGSLGFLAFMSTTKTTTITAAVAALAAATAILQTHKVHQRDLALRAAKSTLTSTENANRELEQRLQQSARQIATRENEPAVGTSKSTAAATPTPSASNQTQLEYVTDHPELRQVFLKREALRTRMHYAPFFASAGLTPEQQDRFVNAWVEATDMRWDFVASARARQAAARTSDEEKSMLAAQLEEGKKMNQEGAKIIRDALGDKFAELKTFPVQERGFVEQVASQVFDTPTPLTPEQARQLQDILVQNRFRRGTTPVSMGGTTFDNAVYQKVQAQTNAQHADAIEWFRPITDTMIEHAQRVLSPIQLSALKNLQSQQVIQFELARAELRRSKTGGL